MPDFLPASDGPLVTWGTRFSEQVSATPAAFNVLPAQATALADLLETYAAAVAVAADPRTRTSATISERNAARAPFKSYARELARIINAFPATTNAVRLQLGLTPRKETISPSQVPDEPPMLEVIGAIGRILKCRLHMKDSTRRGKLPTAAGATVFSFVGSAPPADISLWKFEGSITRCDFNLEFAPTVPAGSQVWLCAFWYSTRAISGPACQPISAYLAGGVNGNVQGA